MPATIWSKPCRCRPISPRSLTGLSRATMLSVLSSNGSANKGRPLQRNARGRARAMTEADNVFLRWARLKQASKVVRAADAVPDGAVAAAARSDAEALDNAPFD